MSRPLRLLKQYFYLAILIVAAAGSVIGGYAYVNVLRTNSANDNHLTIISIPPGSHIEPGNFSVVQILTHGYQFRFNHKVVVGVNNTIEWINNDNVDHTVDLYGIPIGAHGFSSGFIRPGNTFTQTLVVLGLYNYTCIWHPWLAGQITVNRA